MVIEERSLGARITEDMVRRARSTLGIWGPARPWNTVANKDNIRHWCYGIGDMNPLYVDERYGQGSAWGSIVAPPLFVSTFASDVLYPYDPKYEPRVKGANFPGTGELQVKAEWEFHQVVKLDERVRAERALVDLQEVNTDFAGRAFRQLWETRYFHVDGGALVAVERSQVLRYERQAARERKKYANLKKYKYTQQELDAIAESYFQETIRGGQPRWWQDVKVGDSLGHVTHGPITTTEIGIFFVGWGGPQMLTDEIAHMYYRDHPEEFVPDAETNALDLPVRQHWDDGFGKNLGFDAAFDVPMQRLAWFDHLCNNWKGDSGVTKKLSVDFLEPNLLADTTWIMGTVVKKRLEGKEGLVDVEITGIDQRHRTHSRGTATLALPTRGEPRRSSD